MPAVRAEGSRVGPLARLQRPLESEKLRWRMDAMRRLILGPEGRVAGLLVATRACSQQRARADRLKPLHHVKVARHRRRWSISGYQPIE